MGIAPPGLVSHLRHQKACAPQASVLRSTLRSCAVQKDNPSTEQPQPLTQRLIHIEPVSATRADAQTTQHRLLSLAFPRLSPAQCNRISRAELATTCKEINTFVVSRTHCRWQQAWFAARAEHCGASQIATSAGPGGSGFRSWNPGCGDHRQSTAQPPLSGAGLALTPAGTPHRSGIPPEAVTAIRPPSDQHPWPLASAEQPWPSKCRRA